MYQITDPDISKSNRRQISSIDIVYAMFNNTSIINTIQSRIKGKNAEFRKFRDGFDYFKDLESSRKEIQQSMIEEPEKYRKSIFSHWALLLTTLSWAKNYSRNRSLYSQDFLDQETNKHSIGKLLRSPTQSLPDDKTWDFRWVGCSCPDIYVEPSLRF